MVEEIIADTYDITVTIIHHAKLKISNVKFPDQVEENTEFTISYDVINNGEIDTCWGRVIDLDDNSEIPNSKWQESIGTDITNYYEVKVLGRMSDLNARIEIGYYTE